MVKVHELQRWPILYNIILKYATFHKERFNNINHEEVRSIIISKSTHEGQLFWNYICARNWKEAKKIYPEYFGISMEPLYEMWD